MSDLEIGKTYIATPKALRDQSSTNTRNDLDVRGQGLEIHPARRSTWRQERRSSALTTTCLGIRTLLKSERPWRST